MQNSVLSISLNPRTSGWIAALVAGFVSINCPAGTVANESAARNVAPDPLAMGGLVQMTVGLLVVLAFIFVIAWFFKRFGGMSIQVQGAIKTIAVMPLGGRERIALIQVGEQQILIGVSPGRVQTLHVLETPIDTDKNIGTNSFAEKLTSVLKEKIKL